MVVVTIVVAVIMMMFVVMLPMLMMSLPTLVVMLCMFIVMQSVRRWTIFVSGSVMGKYGGLYEQKHHNSYDKFAKNFACHDIDSSVRIGDLRSIATAC
jgi:uncharacterized membrane protein